MLHALMTMRAEGKEVRHVGAIKLLTGPQITKQLAMRAILDKATVKRTGVKAELVKALLELVEKEMVVRGEAVGEAELTGEAAKGVRRRLPG